MQNQKKYGKSSKSIIEEKQSFFNENDKHVKEQKKISDIYIQQPIRSRCKNCNQTLSVEHDLIKDGIMYKICDVCTHLNGAHEDTNEFCQALYIDNDGENYAKNYDTNNIVDFNNRLNNIYIPKADFLHSSLINDCTNPSHLKYLDFGAGSGYFVGALHKIGLKNSRGTEVSKHQVNFGNKMIQSDVLSVHEINSTDNLLEETDANVVSMIGVLEHLQNPRSAMAHIQKNSKIKYLYISVPLFSLSVFLEAMSDDVFHRQLHGGHTHLYTKESLQYLAQEYDFDIISEWWFGTDMVDLYRHIFVQLEKKQSSDKLIKLLKQMLLPVIDTMQLELDKSHFSSEVHLLLRKKEPNII